MTDVITEHIDIWTSAIKTKKSVGRGSSKKQEAYGIKKLRELILELAVRGKLVPQDSNDEPANVLVEKTLGKEKSILNIEDNEQLHELPKGWVWCTLGSISLIERGGSPRPIKSYITESSDGLNWIKIGDTEKGGKYINSTNEKIRKEGLVKTRMVYPGDFLLTNSMSFGRPYITNIEGCIHDGWLRIHPPAILNKDYLYNFLSSLFVATFFKKAAAGAVVLNLNAEKVRNLPTAIPPLNEQKRIAEKVDELMVLCDKLEEEQEENGATHQILVETLLNTLTNVETPEAFTQSWQRIAGHFDLLFTTEKSIDKLQETILQLAVMGKLVAQDPDDEPASVLLEKILQEQVKLVKEKKIKKPRNFLEIEDDEKSFELPKNWLWERIGNIGHDWGQKTPDQTFTYIDVSAIDNVKGIIMSPKVLTASDAPSRARKIVKVGTVIYSTVRPYLQNICVIEQEYEPEPIASTAFAIIHPFQEMSGRFFATYFKSPTFVQYVESVQAGIAYPAINDKQFFSALVPLPPIEEQYRIVAKVDELMVLCDKLRASLQDLQTTQINLADTVAKQLAE